MIVPKVELPPYRLQSWPDIRCKRAGRHRYYCRESFDCRADRLIDPRWLPVVRDACADACLKRAARNVRLAARYGSHRYWTA